MSSILMMSFLDVARSLGPEPLSATDRQVADFVLSEFQRTGGTFNYNPSINALYDLFRGAVTSVEAEDKCRQSGSPAGRKPNGDAVRAIGGYAERNRSNCYRIPFTAVPIGRLSGGRTAYMSIKAPLVRVNDSGIFVVVPGFRMGHHPIGKQIDVAASFALANFARDDFAEADFEYLQAGRGPGGDRLLLVHRGRDRIVYDLDTVDNLLNVFIQGLQLAVNEGAETKAPSFGGYRVVDPEQPRFV